MVLQVRTVCVAPFDNPREKNQEILIMLFQADPNNPSYSASLEDFLIF